MPGRPIRPARVLLLACVLAGLAAASSAAFAQPAAGVYRFSPVNQWDIARTAAYWNPIVQYVEGRSGVKLELKIGRTSADTTSYVLAREVEFVFSNHLFSPDREQLGWKVFGRRNVPQIYGQIAVPADSPIHKLEDLDGKTMVFAGPEAFIGYKVTYGQMLARGINVKVEFGGNQNAAFAQMFAGRAQATGSNSMLIEGYANRENKKFRVLWTSEGYHDLALMASSKVPEAHVRAVAKAFVEMHQDPAGRDILRRASEAVGLSEQAYFVPAGEADYASYRRFYQKAPPSLR